MKLMNLTPGIGPLFHKDATFMLFLYSQGHAYHGRHLGPPSPQDGTLRLSHYRKG